MINNKWGSRLVATKLMDGRHAHLILQSPQCSFAVLGLDEHIYLADVRICPQDLLDKNCQQRERERKKIYMKPGQDMGFYPKHA